MFSDLLIRLRSLFRRTVVEGELNEELQFHLENQVQKYMQSGLTREEAMRRTRLDFGGVDKIKEDCREARGVTLVETLAQDLRFGLRILRKSPGFSAVAVVTLALVVAANAAVFSILNALVLRPVNVPLGRNLYLIERGKDRAPGNPILTILISAIATDCELSGSRAMRGNIHVDGVL